MDNGQLLEKNNMWLSVEADILRLSRLGKIMQILSK